LVKKFEFILIFLNLDVKLFHASQILANTNKTHIYFLPESFLGGTGGFSAMPMGTYIKWPGCLSGLFLVKDIKLWSNLLLYRPTAQKSIPLL